MNGMVKLLTLLISVGTLTVSTVCEAEPHQKRKAEDPLADELAPKKIHLNSLQEEAGINELIDPSQGDILEVFLNSAPEAEVNWLQDFDLLDAQSGFLEDPSSLTLNPAILDSEGAIQFLSYCRNCQEGFASPKELAVHIRALHRGSSPYPCQACQWEGKNNAALEGHHVSDHPDWLPYACPYCSGRFATYSTLEKHFKADHSPGFPCPTCGKRLSSKGNLKVHLRSHSSTTELIPIPDEMPFRCPGCELRYDRAAKLADHIRKNHLELEAYPCQTCEWKGKTQEDFDDHLRDQHSEWKPYVCLECGHRTRTAGNLATHRSFRHRNKVKSLTTSQVEIQSEAVSVNQGIVFQEHENLDLSENLNSGPITYLDYPFCCKECPTVFDKDSLLAKHIRDHHHGLLAYPCQLCAWEGSTQKEWIVHHKQNHPDWRPYLCQQCSLRFRTLGDLDSHQRGSHTGVMWVCETCGRPFTKKFNYDQHQLSHVGGRWLYCDYPGCKSRFKDAEKRDLHRNEGHLRKIGENHEGN